MLREDFIDYLEEQGCVKVEDYSSVINERYRSVITGRVSDVPLEDNLNDLTCVASIYNLGITPTDHLEDLYEVFSGIMNKLKEQIKMLEE